MSTVVVVAGGDPPEPAAVADLADDAYVIAVDSGFDHASRLGLRVDLLVGDLDSISESGLAAAQTAGVAIEQHPAAKDQTDLELALDRAIARHPDKIVVIGGAGGRLDHLLAGALALTSDRYAAVPIEARLGLSVVTVGRDKFDITGDPGDLLTLLPVGAVRGVTTDGLRYPLVDEDLAPGSTRGVSNELLATRARVTVREGVVVAIQSPRD